MGRWEPNATDRLVVAALELFETNGYENTTVIGIAERAGLTKSTFFRHFQDKREVLFGRSSLADVLAEGIAKAPADAEPLEAVACALELLAQDVFTPERRDFIARRQAVVATHPELREREALKGLGLIAAMTGALERRGLPALTARVTAELGALALELAYTRWGSASRDFTEVAREALDEVRSAAPAR
ncbi:TetR/AcrR family transcriptional regulator [Kribbella jejuensis]|uniref:TetR family transcriptional regulator n=1 Tax=Kribbella jejuensis TaxID=236068 RepID=A0A542DTI7_9ACTN|nr:TetR/AcrR family transcriptional regulator [Kribbella jejuensis]TQJ06315.1 TetR family transcriptional regulator [Kribbella jejuensis]